jgi:DNA-binding NarL/FixJ family response regulator
MKIIVISKYALIRDGMVSMISKNDNISIQFVGKTIKEAILMVKQDKEQVVMLDINKDNEEELELIKEVRGSGINVKLVLLDFYGNNEFFIKALKCGVQGYVLGKSNEQEIMYAINQVYSGKKYYDSYFVDYMVTENDDFISKLELLTAREREILAEITSGLSNRKIAEKLLITEHTVKKHVNHIFEKLNIKDRAEAALCVNKYGIVNRL